MDIHAMASISAPLADDGVYGKWLDMIKARARRLVGPETPVFQVPSRGLFDAYLGLIPEGNRKHYACSTCHTFIRRYGSLVVCDGADIASALWHEYDAPDAFGPIAAGLRAVVEKRPISRPFLTATLSLGESTTARPIGSVFHHFAATLPVGFPTHDRDLLSAMRSRAIQAHRNLRDAIGEISPGTLTRALHLLESDQIYRGALMIGTVRRLWNLKTDLEGLNYRQADHRIWRAVVESNSPLQSPRSSVAWPLLVDLEAGKPIEVVKRSSAAKMAPTQYRRPSAPVGDNQIAEAEKLVATLGVARRRSGAAMPRFARSCRSPGGRHLRRLRWSNLPLVESSTSSGRRSRPNPCR